MLLTEVPSNDDELPIKTLQLDFGSIRSFRSAEELRNEQAKHPEFQWPRRAAEQLKRKELLILDLKRVNLRVEFADGVEFKIVRPAGATSSCACTCCRAVERGPGRALPPPAAAAAAAAPPP